MENKILKNHTPVIKQFFSIKKHYSNMLILFQIGDFYELFYEDAKKAASILKIALTNRGRSSNKIVPMSGFPCNKIYFYAKKLLTLGESLVICDQVDINYSIKKLIKRKVVKILTPGTIIEDELLNEKKDNLLASVFEKNNLFGYSILNLNLGKLEISEFNNIDDLMAEIEQHNPEEILYPENFFYYYLIKKRKGTRKRPISIYNYRLASKKILNHFLFNRITIEQLKKKKLGVLSAGSILQYIEFIRKKIPYHIQYIKLKNNKNTIYMNFSTRKNLEIHESLNIANKNRSLFSILDKTSTPMGSRMLKRWLLSPLRNIEIIKKRQDNISLLINLHNKITPILKKINDIERTITRICLNLSTPKDLVDLRSFLFFVPKIKSIFFKISEKSLIPIKDSLYSFRTIYLLLKKSIKVNPSFSLKKGNVISSGFDKSLDYWREIAYNSSEYLKSFEKEQKILLKINSLKIKFNKKLGYFIQVNKNQSHLVPNSYLHKQTLKHAKRFIVPQIDNFQKKLLYAKETAFNIEKKLFKIILKRIKPFVEKIKKTVSAISEIDVLNNLAKRSIQLKYVCPTFSKKNEIQIIDGRHPIIESSLNFPFVANSTNISEEKRMLLITGPNMGGKSTYMRQVAIIVILSYIGSFVPASKAKIGPIDKIFTRIGALDDLYSGKSTFMIEMLETANILKKSTSKSLVLIDELGRGTSAEEGFAIAWSCAEYLAKKINSITLFSTHYTKLSKLEKKNKNIKNVYFDALLNKEKITFIYNLKKGYTNKSYGISVALLSGMKNEVLKTAKKKLKELKNKKKFLKKDYLKKLFYSQQSLCFKFLRIIKNLKLQDLTPLQALKLLHFIQKKINI